MAVPGMRQVDVLLIGGGVAAARCARALRRGGFDGSILIVGDEPHLPYNRPPLSKELLRGEVPEELVLAEPARWYERHNVELLLDTRVVTLDPAGREVRLENDERIGFGVAVLATGARPRRLPVRGGEHALMVRTLADVAAVRAAAAGADHVVVVGGGFIGVEVAASLAMGGRHVTLLEREPMLWGGVYGPEVSDWAAVRLRAAGVVVELHTRVTELTVTAVITDESAFATGVVVAGIGVAPRVELGMAAGLDVDDGVLVDAAQRTSAPAVLAAGDMARTRAAARIEHWHAAREAGERAAQTILGVSQGSRRAPWVFSEFAGAQLDVIGMPRPADERAFLGRVEGRRAVAYHEGQRLHAVALLDASAQAEAVRQLVDTDADIAQLEALLAG